MQKNYPNQNISPTPNEETFDFSLIIGLIQAHKTKIIISVLITLMLSIYYTLNAEPVFRANSTVILKESPTKNLVMDFGGGKEK